MVISAPEVLANNKITYWYSKFLLQWREKLSLQSKSTTDNDHRIASVKIPFTLQIAASACHISTQKGKKLPTEMGLFS